jgi:SAM-dependent methyltransferase
MGNQNQILFLKQHQHKLREPVLEVGSRDYGSTPAYRTIFGLRDYTGVDLTEGVGVDVAVDLSLPAETVDGRLGGRRFRTVICNSMLEHCAQPFDVARNIERLLAPDGHLFISVPFAWKLHGYPSDYWRFTPHGVAQLFPGVEFLPAELSTSEDGERMLWDDYAQRIELRGREGVRRGVYGYGTAVIISLLRRMGLGYLARALRYPYLMPPVLVDMVGVRRATPA